MKKLVLAFLGCALVMNLVGCHGSGTGSKYEALRMTPSEEAIIDVDLALADLDVSKMNFPIGPIGSDALELIEKTKDNLRSATKAMNGDKVTFGTVGTAIAGLVSDTSGSVKPAEIENKVKDIFYSMDSFEGVAIIPSTESGSFTSDIVIGKAKIGNVEYNNLSLNLGNNIKFDNEGKICGGLEDIAGASYKTIAESILKEDNTPFTNEELDALKKAYEGKVNSLR